MDLVGDGVMEAAAASMVGEVTTVDAAMAELLVGDGVALNLLTMGHSSSLW